MKVGSIKDIVKKVNNLFNLLQAKQQTNSLNQ